MTNPDNAGGLPATGPFVDRLIRIFRDKPHDDTSALVLLEYGELCRAAPAGGDRCAFESAMKSAGWAYSMFMRSPVPGHDDLYYEPATSSAWTAWRIAKQGKPDSAPAGSGEVPKGITSMVIELVESARAEGAHSELRSSSDETVAFWKARTSELSSALLRKLQQGAE